MQVFQHEYVISCTRAAVQGFAQKTRFIFLKLAMHPFSAPS